MNLGTQGRATFSVSVAMLLLAAFAVTPAIAAPVLVSSLANATQVTSEPVSIRWDGSLTDYKKASYTSNAGWVASGDGSRVVFASEDWGIVPQSTEGDPHIYVRDRNTMQTILVSTQHGLGATIDADGRFVAFEGDFPFDVGGERQVYSADVDAGTVQLASHGLDGEPGNGMSNGASISAGGRFVTFPSHASNLVPDDTNNNPDVFVFDRMSGAVERISVDSGGQQADAASYQPSISDDGRFVAFRSTATNLVAGDTNGTDDVFVRDRAAGTTLRVSIASDGSELNGPSLEPFISGGRLVAFGSLATNLPAGDVPGSVNVYLHDLDTGDTEFIAAGNTPAISSDGRFVIFNSSTYGSPVAVHDRANGTQQTIPKGDEGWGTNVTGRFVGTTQGSVAYLTDFRPTATNPDHAAADPGPGGTVETGGGVATPTDPTTTSVTTPTGGAVEISEVASAEIPPSGYAFVGQAVTITAPAGTVAQPLRITFRLEASAVPAGYDYTTINLFRNGAFVPDCSTPGAGVAAPDPCIDQRAVLGDGDVALTALTTQASLWELAVATAYSFTGFFAPVDNAPVINKATSGQAIPVRFSLGSNRGLDIFASGSPYSQRTTCDSGAPMDAIETVATAGTSQLSYEAGSNRYQFVWKTQKAWAGTCRTLFLHFADGSMHVALFNFKK